MERQIIMKQNDRICHTLPLRSPQQLDAFLLRAEQHIEGTPRLTLVRQQPAILEVWLDELKPDVLPRLRELNSNQRAFATARRIVVACVRLARRYGCFFLNENMVFLGPRGETAVWINPEVLENRVKIYLPSGPEGEQAMVRSITGFLKLWLRFDYQHLASAWSLDGLLVKFEAVRSRALDRPQPSLSKFAPERPSLNFEEENGETLKAIRSKHNVGEQAKENRLASKAVLALSNEKPKEKPSDPPKMFLSFPNKDKRTSNFKPAFFTEERRLKYKTSFGGHTDGFSIKSDSVQHDYQHKTFNNYPSNTSTNNSVNNSVGLKSGTYFPNRTTSTKPKHHPIVQLINSQDNSPDQYCPNKILISNGPSKDDQSMRKLKESLQGIGEEVNQLFLSNIESENKEDQLKGIAAEFETLLN